MNPISVRLDPDVVEELDAEADEKGVSRNSHLKDIIGRRNEYPELNNEYEKLQSEYSDLREEYDQLKTEAEAYEEHYQEENEKLQPAVEPEEADTEEPSTQFAD